MLIHSLKVSKCFEMVALTSACAFQLVFSSQVEIILKSFRKLSVCTSRNLSNFMSERIIFEDLPSMDYQRQTKFIGL